MLTAPKELLFEILQSEALPAPQRLVCYEWGDKTAAETVLCVHGLTRGGRDFDYLASALSEQRRVLSPDMPGRGKSGWLADPALYNYATYIADILHILKTENITRVHWVGTSMGGIIGMMMASAAPGLIQSMVLNDVGCLIPAAGLRRIFSYAGVKTTFDSRAEAEAALRVNCAPFGIQSEEHWQHFFAHSLEQTADGKTRLAYDMAIAVGFPKADAIADIDLWPFWEAVTKIPVLLIRGETSDILPRDVALAMQAKHPKLELYEVPNAGHAPALMDDASMGKIKTWLNGNSR